MKPEYNKGAGARKNFEDTMSKLFRAPKPEVKKPAPTKKGAPAK
jgi:hypothetical protein